MQINGTIVFFESADEFRGWLAGHFDRERELLVGFYKAGSGRQNMTWSESVDQALCFGWIDGVRKSIDGERYCIRFTPRKPGSTWSRINVDKVTRLREQGLMHPTGIAAFERSARTVTPWYSYENDAKQLPPELSNEFRSHAAAWDFFQRTPPSYRKMAIHWITSAKQAATRQSRLSKVIGACEKNERVDDWQRKR